MKPKARFIKSVIESAKTCETDLPWARGTRRAEFVSRRSASVARRRSA